MADIPNQANEVAAPPAPEVKIRTMASDVAAIKTSGGQLIGGEKSGGLTPMPPPVSAQPIFQSSLGSVPTTGSSKSNLKLVLIIVIVFAIGVVSGLIGYFIIFPWLFNK